SCGGPPPQTDGPPPSRSAGSVPRTRCWTLPRSGRPQGPQALESIDGGAALAPRRSRERQGNVANRGVLKRRRCAGQGANWGIFAGQRTVLKRIPKPRGAGSIPAGGTHVVGPTV